MEYSFKMRTKLYTASTMARLSELYCSERDQSGEGNSTFPKPAVFSDKKRIGVFSYNGRIWNNLGDGRALLYDNRVEA